MPTIRITRRHHLPRAALRRHVETLAEELHRKFQAEYHWEDQTLCFSRTGAHGTVSLDPAQIAVEVKLAAALTPLKRNVEKAINRYLDEHLT